MHLDVRFISKEVYPDMVSAKGTLTNIFAVKIQPHEDILTMLEKFVHDNNITSGVIATGLGSLESVSYFDPEELPDRPGEYAYQNPVEWEDVTELIGISGIICEDDEGAPSLHIHYAVADKKGNTFSGHMNYGNRVFATTDIIIIEFDGIKMGRKLDPVFNLPLFYPTEKQGKKD